MVQTKFSKLFNIDLPLIMAPMFLVSDEKMVKAAINNRIIGTFPSLNYRESEKLNAVLHNLNNYVAEIENPGSYGVNIITQKSNPYYKTHLNICIKNKVPFYITSLGNPKEVIEEAHRYGAKVFCDVATMKHAEKAAAAGADGLIAVGQGAGGHAGNEPLHILIPALKDAFPELLIIAAGGIATGKILHSVLVLGAEGASVGTGFIASKEAPVSPEYKKAIVDAKSEDIVMTSRISGTPATIINTPYAQKIGYRQNRIEKMLSNNPRTKKYFKMLVQMKGMKKLEKSVKPGNYKNLWIAGKSVQHIHEISSIEQIVLRLKTELEKSVASGSFV